MSQDDEDRIVHEVVAEFKASSLQNRVHHFSSKVQLRGGNDDVQKGLLVDVMASFEKKVDELLTKYIKDLAKTDDRAQIILASDAMNAPISTKMLQACDLTTAHLLTTLTKSQNSGLSLKFDDAVTLEFVHVRKDKGWNNPGAGAVYAHLYYKQHRNKTSVRRVSVQGDKACLAAGVILGKAHARHAAAKKEQSSNVMELRSEFEKLMNNRGSNARLKKAVSSLYTDAGFAHDTILDLTHIPKIESLLDVSLKVVSAESNYEFVYKGPVRSDALYVYLIYDRLPGDSIGHYDLITNVKGFFSKKHYCVQCDIAYEKNYSHFCKDTRLFWCFACHRDGCEKALDATPCKNCGVPTQNDACSATHMSDYCKDWWFCQLCKKRFARRKVLCEKLGHVRLSTDEEEETHHSCDQYYCDVCKDNVPIEHRCFVKKRKLHPKMQKYLFFDFETDQSTKTHIVNYAHMTYYVPTTRENKMKTSADDQDHLTDHDKWEGSWVSKSFQGEGCLTAFLKTVISDCKGYTCIAHNLKAFDGLFILRDLLENNVIPEVIMKGQKILELRIPNVKVRFIDSFSFLPMSLAKLPSAFGLSCGDKGYFPHFFNTPKNQEYVDQLPDENYFGVSQMSSGDREKFQRWHREKRSEKYIFNFREEMAHYCALDVEILKNSCLVFRRTLCAEAGADPFTYVTLASVCAAIYYSTYMPNESIARVPPSGYQRANYSSEALEWLEFQKVFCNVKEMQHAGNSGEVRVSNYFVDGYDSTTKTIYEYYGCFHHGCERCFSGDMKNPETKRRLAISLSATQKRERLLKNCGYKVIAIWGCAWTRLKSRDPDLFAKVKSLKVPTPLNPRHAFFGGRTEAFVIWAGGKAILYQDVTSLYPWVNSRMRYPVGHPDIITNDFGDLSIYFGLVKCTVIPPHDLHLPVLPMHVGPEKKLLFPLCRTCAETFQTQNCDHSAPERAITGTWFTEEVKLALDVGYQMEMIHSVWHFPETCDYLFAEYVKTFYKKKLCSSKLPFSDPSEVQAFIKSVKDREGITINSIQEFKENPGLRQVSKLILNNIWGRFGMGENLSKSCFMTEFKQLEEMLDDPKIEVQGVRVISENVVQVISRAEKVEYLETSKDTNIFIAVVTTGWARIRLYKELQKLGKRVLYCDTDSFIYEKSDNPSENLSNGPFLGDLTNELDGDEVIEQFVSGGPKAYGYLTSKGKTVVKVKGFSLNSTNSPAFCFENFKNVVLNGLDGTSATMDDTSVFRVGITAGKKRKLETDEARSTLMVEHLLDEDTPSAIANDQGISTYNPLRIFRTRDFQVKQQPEQKFFSFCFNKRIILSSLRTIPFGFVEK